MGKCFYCGHEVRWESDFNGDEVYGEDSEHKDSVVSYYTCPHCGAFYEVRQPDSIPSES